MLSSCRRALLAALVAVFAVTGTSPASATPRQEVQKCQERHPWQRVRHRARLIWCIAHRLNAPGTPRYAVQIARCESGLALQDLYGGDGYVGTFQHITDAWHGRWEWFGRSLGVPSGSTNVWSQTVVSVRMAKTDGTWSRQWSCA